MSENLELIIRAKDEASKAIKDVSKEVDNLDKETKKTTVSTGGLWKSFAVGGIAANLIQDAFRGASEQLKSTVTAAMNAETAQNNLRAALEITGRPAELLTQHFVDLSSALQKETIYADDAIQQATTLLAQLTNLDKEGLEKATKGTLGFASALRMDLNSATNIVAKAMAGNASVLSRYGITIDTTKTKEEQRNEVMDKLIALYPRATAETETFTGKQQQLKNNLDDVKETIGYVIMDALKPMIEALNDPAVMHAITEIGKSLATIIKLAADVITWVVKAWKKNEEMREKAMMRSPAYRKIKEQEAMAIKRTTDMILDEGQATNGNLTLMDEEAKKRAELIRKQQAAAEAKRNEAIVTYEAKQATEQFNKELENMNALMGSMNTGDIGIISGFHMSAEAADDFTLSLNQNKKSMFNLSGATWDETAANRENIKTVNEENDKWSELESKLNLVGYALDQVGNLFSAFGIDIQGVISNVKGVITGIGTFKKSMESINSGTFKGILEGATSIIGTVSAAISLVVTLGKALAKLFKGDGVGEAIERENKWMNLTKEQIKNLKELEKQYGSTHAATSVMLDEIINTAEVTNKNFDMWTDRVRGILSDLDQGKLSIQQTQKEIGDAFSALLGKAKELGTEGSASLMNFFDDLASRGLKVGEVQEYINEQLQSGLEGYKAMKAAMGENADAMEAFGNINIEVYEEMIRYQNLVEQNQGLVNGIKGAEQALISLSNTQKLTEEQFDSFSLSAKTSFDKLVEGGMNSSQALQTLAPYLQRLQFLHEEYGYTIDENTQKILDQAKEEGKVIENKKTETQQIIGLLEKIADVLGADIPSALGQTAKAGTDAFKELSKGAREYGKALDEATRPRTASITTKYQSGQEDVGAATGFEGWVAKPTRFLVGEAGPEYVSVTPRNKVGSGSGEGKPGITVEQNIYINGVNLNKDEIIQAIKTAIPNNEQGLRTIVQQAVAEAY